MVELATIATGLDPVAQPRAAAVDNGSYDSDANLMTPMNVGYVDFSRKQGSTVPFFLPCRHRTSTSENGGATAAEEVPITATSAAARFDTEQTSTNRALTLPMTGMELIQQVLELCTDLLVMA